MHSVCVLVSNHRIPGSTFQPLELLKTVNTETVNIMKTDHLNMGVESVPKSLTHQIYLHNICYVQNKCVMNQ
jgi:hypothetical protein